MTNTIVTGLFEEIAHHLGVEALSQDEHGLCELILNDRTVIMLRVDESLQRLTLLGPVSGMSGPEAKETASRLFMGHSIVALTHDAPQLAWSEALGLIAYHHLPLHGLEADRVCHALASLFEWLSQAAGEVLSLDGQQALVQSASWV
ncbi:CesT family type III secretion system chaperone [Aeromonas veronii]